MGIITGTKAKTITTTMTITITAKRITAGNEKALREFFPARNQERTREGPFQLARMLGVAQERVGCRS
jgi:hypothetical protein